jgi:hypothetical protein
VKSTTNFDFAICFSWGPSGWRNPKERKKRELVTLGRQSPPLSKRREGWGTLKMIEVSREFFPAKCAGNGL